MNNSKQLSRLMVFACVAQKGSFTQAAESLGMTKSAVSQQVKALESELGIRVLNRTTRGVSLTALGEKLLLRCQILQDQVELAFTDIANAEENPSGRFAITFPHALEAIVVMPAIEQLCFEYPGLEPELVASDKSLDLVESDLDVAVHAGELADSSYRALPVGTMKEIFCATPLFLNRTSRPETVEELSDLPWISTGWQQAKASVLDVHSNEKSNIHLKQVARVNTLPSALELSRRHLGMVLLPDVIAKPLIKSGELVHILDTVTGPLWPVYTTHAYQADKPIHLTRFHQLVCRYFNSALI
ncbi:MAG: LysR family transcriptional regulator [Marinobacter sp.]